MTFYLQQILESIHQHFCGVPQGSVIGDGLVLYKYADF